MNVLNGEYLKKQDLKARGLDETTEYMFSKNRVNGTFGMMCTALYCDKTDTKFNFNVTKTELEEYSEKLKENRKYSFLVPECYSADGRIMYTKSLFYTLKKCGFERLAGLCADFMCVAMNGFDGSHLDGILQIGNFGFFGTEEQYFESFSVLEIYSKAIASSVNDDSSNAREYLALFEEEKKLARHMANLEILAIIELS